MSGRQRAPGETAGRTTATGVGLAALLVAACQGPSGGSPAVERVLPTVTADVAPPLAVPQPELESPMPQAVVMRPWRFGEYEGRIVETPHYRIHTTVESDSFVERLPTFFEAALDRYRSELGDLPTPTRPLETYLFADNRQWQAKTRQLLPEQASQFSNLGSGGYTTRGIAVLFYLDRNDTFAIAAHEGWHQYTQTTFRDPLPVWLEEGIATYMEVIRLDPDGASRFRPSRNFERWYALRRNAQRDRLIPLEELLARSPQEYLVRSKPRLLAYYAQVWALTRFLLEGEDGRYADTVHEVLRHAAAGRLYEEAARRLGPAAGSVDRSAGIAIARAYFGEDLAELEAGYRRYVETLVRPRHRTARIDQ